MKKFLTFITILFVVISTTAQVGTFQNLYGRDITTGQKFYSPLYDTTWTPIRPGALTTRPQDSLVYRWTGKKWTLASSSESVSSTNISNTDLTLTGNRTLNLGTNQLVMTGTGTGGLLLNNSNGAKLYSSNAGFFAEAYKSYLYAQDSIYFKGYGAGDIVNFSKTATDTIPYKPVAMSSTGAVVRLDRWPGSGGGGGGIADDSINTWGKSVQMYAAVLKVDRSGSANTWSILSDAGHDPLGVTGITADASKISVSYTPGSKVMTMLAVQDETMSISAVSNSGTPYYTYGPYSIGARTYVDHAEFTISRLMHASFIVYYDGTNWVVSSGTIKGTYTPTSPAWSITWSSGRLRISGVAAGFRKVPSGNMVAWGGNASNLKYVPGFNIISDTFIDIYFYDITTAAQYTAATPPANFAIYLDFGVFQAPVDPTSEDFGVTGSTNFWMFGMMKK